MTSTLEKTLELKINSNKKKIENKMKYVITIKKKNYKWKWKFQRINALSNKKIIFILNSLNSFWIVSSIVINYI